LSQETEAKNGNNKSGDEMKLDMSVEIPDPNVNMDDIKDDDVMDLTKNKNDKPKRKRKLFENNDNDISSQKHSNNNNNDNNNNESDNDKNMNMNDDKNSTNNNTTNDNDDINPSNNITTNNNDNNNSDDDQPPRKKRKISRRRRNSRRRSNSETNNNNDNDSNDSDSESNIESDDSNTEYIVQDVGNFKYMDNELKWDVKWENYDQTTFEPARNLLDNEHFHDNIKQKRNNIRNTRNDDDNKNCELLMDSNIDVFFNDMLPNNKASLATYLRQTIKEAYTNGNDIQRICLAKLFDTNANVDPKLALTNEIKNIL